MLGRFNARMALQLAGANLPSTTNNGAGISTNLLILDSIIPGFSIVRELFLNYFKYDITSLVTRAIFVAVAVRTVKYLEEEVKNSLLKFFCSSVTISGTDRVHREVASWMAAHIVEKGGAQHIAVRSSQNANVASHHPMMPPPPRHLRHVPTEIDETTPPISYAPTLGTHWFWYHFRPFMLKQLPRDPASRYHPTLQGVGGDFIIYCFGRNAEPLKHFIADCKKFDEKKRALLTTLHIKRSYNSGWSGPILKPNRPLDTIDMEGKNKLLQDIQEYLHPTARRSYGRRGIPYRRGYLFYGPPGTGKTSMCFALAGHLKLELYSVSGNGLSDVELAMLFDALPPKCIVLLEDIDSAGITREHADAGEDDQEVNQSSNVRLIPPPNKEISLSGLLNAIDGANAPEGRILVMTTNTPEKLDKALIRPGRIDKMIYFGPISRKGAEEVFMRMFAPDNDAEEEHSIWLVDKSLTEAQLTDLAVQFSNKIPEGRITPAEVQGFLVDIKNPKKSIDEAEAWVKKTLESRDDAKAFEKMETGAEKPSTESGTETEKTIGSSRFETNGHCTPPATVESTPKKEDVVNRANTDSQDKGIQTDSGGTDEQNGEIKQAFLPTWDAYKRRASLDDQAKPLSDRTKTHPNGMATNLHDTNSERTAEGESRRETEGFDTDSTQVSDSK